MGGSRRQDEKGDSVKLLVPPKVTPEAIARPLEWQLKKIKKNSATGRWMRARPSAYGAFDWHPITTFKVITTNEC